MRRTPSAAFIGMLSVARPGDWISEIKKTVIVKAIQDSHMICLNFQSWSVKRVVIRRIALSQRSE
jgi:hypothetical protein